MLSDKAYNLLANTLAPRIANALQCSDAFVNLMHEEVPGLITSELGDMDEETLFELSLCVMDRIYLKTATVGS